MRNTFHTFRSKQGGFTLMELLIVLSLISLLAGLTIFTYSGDKSKGTVLYSKLTQYGDALIRMQIDTSCYPQKTGALVQESQANTSFCNQDLRTNWNGPYAKAESVDANGAITLPEIGTNVTLTIGLGNNINGSGLTRQWYVQANNVPEKIALEAAKACNKNKTGATPGPCVLGTAANGVNTVRFIFDEAP